MQDLNVMETRVFIHYKWKIQFYLAFLIFIIIPKNSVYRQPFSLDRDINGIKKKTGMSATDSSLLQSSNYSKNSMESTAKPTFTDYVHYANHCVSTVKGRYWLLFRLASPCCPTNYKDILYFTTQFFSLIYFIKQKINDKMPLSQRLNLPTDIYDLVESCKD